MKIRVYCAGCEITQHKGSNRATVILPGGESYPVLNVRISENMSEREKERIIRAISPEAVRE